MKKKIVLDAISLFLVGGLIGGVFHLNLSKGNYSIIISIIEGIFVGIIISMAYIALTIIMSFSFKYKEKLNRNDKILAVPLTIIGGIYLWCSIINLITMGTAAIVPYWWMNAICIALVLLIIFKAKHDAKEVAKRI